MLRANKQDTHYVDLTSMASEDSTQELQTTSLYHHKQFNAMILTLPAGHRLKEHVSPRMLTLQILSGTGSVTVDAETYTIRPGGWFFIAPNIPHEIVSSETLTVLLSLYASDMTGGQS